MRLSEAKIGQTVMVETRFEAPPTLRGGLRDKGLYERGIVFIDGNDGEFVTFHKDSIPMAVGSFLAEKVVVGEYVPGRES